MDAEERQSEILNLLREHERVTVDDLSTRFGVSNQTIRTDLRDLSNRGLATRTHGGAVRVDQVSNREYAERRKLKGQEKEAMGGLTASLIPDSCSVSLNIGTSTEQVAKALSHHKDLTVLSNNINIINILIGTQSKELILVGGAVRQSDGAIVGEDAVEFIERYKVDYAVIGASALDADGSVLDYDAREVSVARAILRNSRIKILVCDSSKFERSAPIRICALQDLDYVVTDQVPPIEFIEAARAGQTEILVLDELNAS
ncbi:DeoR/GlpR family DNA-binding transcription regulator [Falsiruegeria mediterranea]|uniref:Glycerol-3-phosphate regulon repressor n=1 Tax=Falsiruegeria mediterranea M17 TaxID=1200281 RepID=A0A2R8CDX8_9RHOB|nr:DeoR/GlpR family DNA-binding transcription regulator [Falsiruegeria mediterranea]SPJ30589.1 Glycerol-3-phosphate regulon repressor [Falsiruegeria mediterranea M17]